MVEEAEVEVVLEEEAVVVVEEEEVVSTVLSATWKANKFVNIQNLEKSRSVGVCIGPPGGKQKSLRPRRRT